MSEFAIQEARAIVHELAGQFSRKTPLGSFSTSIYDTAWLSLVFTKDESPKWLFPESFQYLLDAQLPSGGWQVYASETDGLLNTMAAILAIKEHLARPELAYTPLPEDLQQRLDRASACLSSSLQTWDVASTLHVGFEILVPRLLSLLEQSDDRLDFPGRPLLYTMQDKKLAKFHPKILYSNTQTTLLHSLEAFIGLIDFDKVSHHLNSWGSMMLSPASTAAYLIHSSKWDVKAEQYLRSVVANSSGQGCGAVPSAFPSGIFELSWTVSSLLKSGLTKQDFDTNDIEQLSSILSQELEAGKGLVGFDTGVLSDADDTAKTVLSLALLGHDVDPANMVAEFETPTHFRTYHNEQNSSMSANCNMLQALLHCPNPNQYIAQINKVTQFLCNSFYEGHLRDKWNLSAYYLLMLLTHSFAEVLKTWDASDSFDVSPKLLQQNIPIILSQISLQLLRDQQDNGSWRYQEADRETTAYAVIALRQLSNLPWLTHLQERMHTATSKGVAFLQQNIADWKNAERIWIEKVSYGLPPLARVYMVCAMLGTDNQSTSTWGSSMAALANYPQAKIPAMAKFFSKIPMFSQDERWLLEADVALGYLFQDQLKEASSIVFPRGEDVDYKYLEYIPFTWISTNRRNGYPLNNIRLWDTMMIAVLDYQLDEYMETVCDKDPGMLESMKDVVRGLFSRMGFSAHTPATINDKQTSLKRNSVHDGGYSSVAKKRKIIMEGTGLMSSDDDDNAGDNENEACLQEVVGDSRDSVLHAASDRLSRFISNICEHDKVKQAPTRVRDQLLQELKTCILAHLSHEQDNQSYADQRKQATNTSTPEEVHEFYSKKYTYHSWLHLVSADNTHSPFTWVYFSCLAAKPDEPLFCGAVENYLASSASQHLANLCRQYNDAGSFARDQAEGNLNSLNFAEFHETGSTATELVNAKKDLMTIAEYERAALESTVSKLFDMMRQRSATNQSIRALQMFIDTVDLYGQLYVQRDLTQRVK